MFNFDVGVEKFSVGKDTVSSRLDADGIRKKAGLHRGVKRFASHTVENSVSSVATNVAKIGTRGAAAQSTSENLKSAVVGNVDVGMGDVDMNNVGMNNVDMKDDNWEKRGVACGAAETGNVESEQAPMARFDVVVDGAISC